IIAPAMRQTAATMRKADNAVAEVDRAMNWARARTPNAISGASTMCESRKNRCKTNNADGAALRFRSVIQTKNGPVKTNATRLNQKYQRVRRKAWIAPKTVSNPATGPKETQSAASRSQGGPPV